LLYDAYIRRFQSAAEREAEGKKKGYSRTLEASLLRGEEKLGRLRNGEVTGRIGDRRQTAENGPQQPGLYVELDQPKPKTAEEGRERWHEYLQERFVTGLDDEFDYSTVDGAEEYDVMASRDQEDEWFDDEPPDWAGGDEGVNVDAEPGTSEAQVRRGQGETGIQDF
jgi:hypothetical protein